MMSKGAFRGFLIFALIVACLCFALGAWQIQRHFWKADLLEQAAQVAAAPAISLPTDTRDLQAYQRVQVQGRFIIGKDIPIRGFAVKGISGSRLYAPFELNDGRVLTIQRGWVARGQEAARVAEASAESLALDLIWRPVTPREGGGRFAPSNVPEMGHWTYIDTKALASFWQAPNLIQGAVGELRGPEAAAHGARIEPFRADLFNRHLEYVITWWALAAAMLGICALIWSDQRRQNRRQA